MSFLVVFARAFTERSHAGYQFGTRSQIHAIEQGAKVSSRVIRQDERRGGTLPRLEERKRSLRLDAQRDHARDDAAATLEQLPSSRGNLAFVCVDAGRLAASGPGRGQQPRIVR